MKKKTLDERLVKAKSETAQAIEAILDALNKGQRKKIAKDERVAVLLERYGIAPEDDE
ncbi:MAG: hypothetical protein IKN38_08640 [Clostridia bacterium]|nr:hypothetical protein [Clostridia bacterium]